MTLKGLSAAVLVAALLAGCADPGAPGPMAAPGASADRDTGAVAGLIVDDDFLPLAGADVGLDDGSAIAKTDEGGAFRLDGVAPGSYGIFASALGFSAAAQRLTVRAGETTEVTLALDRLALVEPYSELTIRNGYWTCAVATLAAVPNCGVLVESDGNSEHWYGFTVSDGWNSTIVEVAWEYSNAGQQTTPGAWFSNFGTDADNESYTFGEFFGDNPLKAQYHPGQPITAFDGQERDEFPQEGYDHYGYVFPWGMLADESQPVYSLAFGSYSRGVGVSVSQAFTVFATVFYHAPPEHGYTAMPDA